ncbi:MAG TPA: RDD family protein [Gammaproteobacteria bacterium]|nr:RDD family protein [Gammaproteobacteria bacterium]
MKEPTNPATYRPAGLVRRLAAIFYDALLLFALWMVSTGLWVAFRHGQAVPAEYLPFQLFLALVAFLFLGGFWTHGGSTLGMMAWHLRVVDARGRRVTWGRALRRYLAAILSWALCGLGFLYSLVDRDRRALHDILSGTRLVVVPHAKRPR